MSQCYFDERGREYETFLRVLNWQCLTSTADTRGEQLVLRHMRRTGKEAGGVCRGHFSFCLAQQFWYNYKVQLPNYVDPIQSESKLSSSSGIVRSYWVRTWIKNVLYKLLLKKKGGLFWWYIHYLPFFLSLNAIKKTFSKRNGWKRSSILLNVVLRGNTCNNTNAIIYLQKINIRK